MRKPIIILALIFLLITRFVFVDKFPVGLSNDEIEYAISAKTYALVGKDVSGYSFPLSLFKTQTDGIISAIPPLLLSPIFSVIPLNQANIRIVFVIINLVTLIPLYLITKKLFSKRIALISSFLFLINPWNFYYSRTAVEAPFAFLFYMLGIYLLISKSNKKNTTLSFLFLVLGFFSYHAAKFIFIPIVLILAIYNLYQNKQTKKYQLAIIFSSLAIVAIFWVISTNIEGSILNSRKSDLIFDNQYISQIVDNKRRQEIQFPLNNLFVNKATETVKIFIKNYLDAFSPETLIISGDKRATYRFGDHGLFYIIDIIFLILGFVAIYKRGKAKFFLLTSLILVAPIPTAISRVETSVIYRSFLILPLFLIIISVGINEITSLNKKAINYLIIIIYTILFANFLNFYFARFPITNQENYWLGERVLFKYLSYADNTQKVIVVTNRPRSTYLRFVIMSENNIQKQILERQELPYIEGPAKYDFGHIEITNICPTKIDTDQILAINQDTGCEIKEKQSFNITDQKDSGAIFKIYNSQICKDYSKETYRRLHKIELYGIEKLKYEEFCLNWINTPL